MNYTTLLFLGLSPVGGKPVVSYFDRVRMSPDGGIMLLRKAV